MPMLQLGLTLNISEIEKMHFHRYMKTTFVNAKKFGERIPRFNIGSENKTWWFE